MNSSPPPTYDELTNEKTCIAREKSMEEVPSQRQSTEQGRPLRRSLVIDIDFELLYDDSSPPQYSEVFSNELPTYESVCQENTIKTSVNTTPVFSRRISTNASPFIKCTCTKLGRVVSWISLFLAVGFCIAAFFSWL